MGGTYALLLQLSRPAHIQIGKLGAFDFPRGYFVYTGSAHGAGGLGARVTRHWNMAKCLHWHVDYLRAIARPVGAWYSMEAGDDECAWARILAASIHAKIIAPRFGATDCDCPAHLYHFETAVKARRALDFGDLQCR